MTQTVFVNDVYYFKNIILLHNQQVSKRSQIKNGKLRKLIHTTNGILKKKYFFKLSHPESFLLKVEKWY